MISNIKLLIISNIRRTDSYKNIYCKIKYLSIIHNLIQILITLSSDTSTSSKNITNKYILIFLFVNLYPF